MEVKITYELPVVVKLSFKMPIVRPTVRDFLLATQVEQNLKVSAVLVNGRFVTKDHILKDGDHVTFQEVK